jgi:hypothetical protein
MTQVKVGADRVIAGTGNPVVIPPYWRDLGQDSVIAAESASGAMAITIHGLCPYGGKIFLGYGSYEANSQSGAVRYWDGDSFETLTSFNTESYSIMRVIDDVLYVVGNDVSVGNNGHDYVSYDGTTASVKDDNNLDAAHAFDIIEWPADGAYYFAGQAYNNGAHNAAVWRSTDAGANWTRYLVRTGTGWGRVYGVLIADGKLWCQPWNWSTDQESDTAYYSSNGTTWSAHGSIDLIVPSNGVVWKPHVVDGLAVYLNRPGVDHGRGFDGSDNYLTTFDGTTVTQKTAIGEVYDTFLDGSTLYVLTEAGEILTTTDLSSFTTVTDDAPAAGRSICVDGGAVYVGTTDSHLWKYV